jgi:hypothetical protein
MYYKKKLRGRQKQANIINKTKKIKQCKDDKKISKIDCVVEESFTDLGCRNTYEESKHNKTLTKHVELNGSERDAM